LFEFGSKKYTEEISYEIIVVDNASEDRTVEVVAKKSFTM